MIRKMLTCGNINWESESSLPPLCSLNKACDDCFVFYSFQKDMYSIYQNYFFFSSSSSSFKFTDNESCIHIVIFLACLFCTIFPRKDVRRDFILLC